MALNRESFFAVMPMPQIVEVELPDGLGTMKVRQVSMSEKDRLELSMQGKDRENIRARWLVACAVDDDGKNMFTYNDLDKLSDYPASVFEPVLDAILKLNGVTNKDIEDMEKKS